MKYINNIESKILAIALRKYAEIICMNPDTHSVEEARSLDRALRCCPGISDIDRVWIRWSFLGESRGWLTDNEIMTKSGRRTYPKET